MRKGGEGTRKMGCERLWILDEGIKGRTERRKEEQE